MTALDLGVEDPSLAPEQHKHPGEDQQVGEARQPAHCEVLAQLMRGPEQHHRGHAPASGVPEVPEGAGGVGGEGAAVVDQ